ncbi:MAG TPA: RodZ domain-containing protein, partial [Vicinamibacterales bacterium]|nr:RodZ domain-containing protein [Vicinamibacterales bacterium]
MSRGDDPNAPDHAALEHEMLEAADRESREIVVNARREVRDILLRARQELLVLRAQISAAHEHFHASGEERPRAVRELLGSVRPDVQALDREAGAMQATLANYRRDIAADQLEGASRPPDVEASAIVPHEPDLDEAGEAAIDRHPPVAEAVPDLLSHIAQPRRGRRVLPAAIAVVVIAAGAFAAVYWAYNQPASVARRSASRAPAAAHVTPPAAAPAPAPAADAPPAPPTASVPPASTAPPPADSAVPPGETHLVLQATGTVWVRVNVDDGEDAGRIMAAGDRREATGHHIAVRAGNAGALTVSTNGGPFEVFGQDDTPLTRQFGRAPSTPAPPPAATPTPSVSSAAPAGAGSGQAPRAATARAPAQAAVPATPEAEVTRAAEAWLRAFFAGDRAAMARAGSPNAAIEDLRTPADRPPAGVVVRRTLEQPVVRIAGSTAIYTSRLV